MKSSWNSDEPWFEDEDFIKIIIDKAKILDIVKEYGLKTYPSGVGNFTHKMKCPLPQHFDGNERTASLFISENDNSFYCFGCSAGTSVIDFVSLYRGMPFYKVVEMLSKKYGLTGDMAEELEIIKQNKRRPEHTIIPYIYTIGVLIREHLKTIKNKNRGKWNAWAEKQFRRLDYCMKNCNDDDWEKIKKYQERVINFIQQGRL